MVQAKRKTGLLIAYDKDDWQDGKKKKKNKP